MDPLKKVAIVANLTKTGTQEVSQLLVKICLENHVEVNLTEQFPCPPDFLYPFDPETQSNSFA